jgi:hypothetical protein
MLMYPKMPNGVLARNAKMLLNVKKGLKHATVFANVEQAFVLVA